MSFRFAFVFFFAFAQNFAVAALPLSENAQISLITCGAGADLYATFGHSAIYISDRRTGIDKVYNYGTFDFDTPGFYTKFTQGKLNYMLSVSTFDQFMRTYQYEGRWVNQQVLDLTPEEQQELYDFLEINALPENKDYKYDFFYDNCSTRIRDVFETVLGDKLRYRGVEGDTIATFRDMIGLYLSNHPWSDLGIDLALGAPCDEQADFREKMFLPDYLKNGMAQAELVRDGETIPFIGKSGLILPENPALHPNDTATIHWIFWSFFVFCLFTSIFWKAERMRWFDVVFFGICGLLGVAILLLWFATDHLATKWNMNILWALPTWLYGAFILASRREIGSFFKVHAAFLLFIIIAWAWIPQDLNGSVIPVVLALLARSWAWQKSVFKIQKA